MSRKKDPVAEERHGLLLERVREDYTTRLSEVLQHEKEEIIELAEKLTVAKKILFALEHGALADAIYIEVLLCFKHPLFALTSQYLQNRKSRECDLEWHMDYAVDWMKGYIDTLIIRHDGHSPDIQKKLTVYQERCAQIKAVEKTNELDV